MRDVLRKKDNNQIPDFSVSYPYSYLCSSSPRIAQVAVGSAVGYNAFNS